MEGAVYMKEKSKHESTKSLVYLSLIVAFFCIIIPFYGIITMLLGAYLQNIPVFLFGIIMLFSPSYIYIFLYIRQAIRKWNAWPKSRKISRESI